MENNFLILLIGLALVQTAVYVVWIVAYRIQKTSLIDTVWSLFIFLAATVYFAGLGASGPIAVFCLVLAALWALRLSLYIYGRSRGHGEDPRYRALRSKWGKDEKRKMLIFYFQQGAAAWLFAWPFFLVFASSDRATVGFWEWAGAAIWLAAFAGESAADHQLAQFKRNPHNHGQVCQAGLWRYSRHPNYFFEWLNWIAYAWLAWPHAWGFTGLICPLLMYYFLTHVSGIPLAEKRSLETKPDAYAQYQKTTSAFFPWFPKKAVRA